MLRVSRTEAGRLMLMSELLRIEQRTCGVFYVAQPGASPSGVQATPIARMTAPKQKARCPTREPGFFNSQRRISES